MGSDDGEPDEKPVHEVEVAAFDLDRTEVTVEDYRRCVEAKVCTEPGTGNRSSYWMNDPSLPVNYIDSKQAEQFCAWNGEKRLPTEEEWEFAARGPEGRRFAWGDTPPDLSVGCWGGRPILREQGPCPVGFFPSTNTPNGLADMTGNLWEWTSSGYAFVYEKPRDNSKRVYRGGSWDDSYTLAPKRQREYVERATRRFRNLPTIRGPMVGVRCAKSV
jgi:formylglycine-generating enzyme required for sulfatase activity